MKSFQKFHIYCSDREIFIQACEKALRLGYNWAEGMNIASAMKIFDDFIRANEESQANGWGRRFEWMFLLMESNGTILIESRCDAVIDGYCSLYVHDEVVTKLDGFNLQTMYARKLNGDPRFCYATPEMQISHGRADVFAIAYDKRIYEYEVKVAKSDFDSELKSIKHIMDGIKNTEPGSKLPKHKAYLLKDGVNQPYHIIPDYFYFIVSSDLHVYAKEQLKGTPYGLISAVGIRGRNSDNTRYHFEIVKQPRKLPGVLKLSQEALWNILITFGHRAKVGHDGSIGQNVVSE